MLPVEIVYIILLLIPARYAVPVCFVCKLWRSILKDVAKEAKHNQIIDNTNLLKWYRHNGRLIDHNMLCAFATMGRLDLIECAFGVGVASFDLCGIATAAAFDGHLDVVKWAHTKTGSCSSIVTTIGCRFSMDEFVQVAALYGIDIAYNKKAILRQIAVHNNVGLLREWIREWDNGSKKIENRDFMDIRMKALQWFSVDVYELAFQHTNIHYDGELTFILREYNIKQLDRVHEIVGVGFLLRTSTRDNLAEIMRRLIYNSEIDKIDWIIAKSGRDLGVLIAIDDTIDTINTINTINTIDTSHIDAWVANFRDMLPQ